MNTRKQIEQHMKEYYAADVKLLYELMENALLNNADFRCVMNEGDFLEAIQEECNEIIDFSMDTILDKESLAIFKRIDEIQNTAQKLIKATRVQLIADVFSNEALFEGFCLSFCGSNDMLESMCNNYACGDQYRLLSQDSAFQKRRKYISKITEYVQAAVHLYGVVDIREFEDIILSYEKSLKDDRGYNRKQGNYQNTIMYSPRFFGFCALQNLIGDGITNVFTTLDGLFLHSSFREEYVAENKKMITYFKSKTGDMPEKYLAEFFYSVSDASYRNLYEEASEKPFYLPSKKEFLRYADENYYENTIEEKKLRNYIENNYMNNFATVAEKIGVSTSECLDGFFRELHDYATDIGKAGDERNPNEFVDFLFSSMQEYSIDMEDLDRANEILSIAMGMINSVRLWVNHGCTPNELRKAVKRPQNMTIVPGSSRAAEMLLEGREELEKMGVQLDMDGNATIEGTKKIYPNNPCPCGSGKKYKKCCGKN